MAQKVSLRLIDDLDGSEAKGTIEFGMDGVLYEMELSEANEQKLRDALAGFVAKARKTGGRKKILSPVVRTGAKSPGGSVRRNDELADIRKWAREQGLKVANRGRISAEVRDAYRESNQLAPAKPAPEVSTEPSAGRPEGAKRASKAKKSVPSPTFASAEEAQAKPDTIEPGDIIRTRAGTKDQVVAHVGQDGSVGYRTLRDGEPWGRVREAHVDTVRLISKAARN